MGIILQKIYMVESGTSHVDMFYTTLGIIAGDAQGICIISGITLPIFSKKILIWEFMIQHDSLWLLLLFLSTNKKV